MGVYFTSDLHLGHKSICKYRTRFNTPKEHDEYILSKIENLGKRDVLYVVGDFLFDGEHYENYLSRIENSKCRIKLVMGNHDSKQLYNVKYCSNIEMQLPLFSYRHMWISHCPIHPDELRGRLGNIHGHLHLEKIQKDNTDDDRYFNVNLDVNDYEFVELQQIKDYFS